MLYTANSKLSIYNVTIKNLEDDFEFTTEMNAVNKDVFLNVPPNPNYGAMLTKYFHLIEIKMNENQTKHSPSWERVTSKRLGLKKDLEYDR